MAERGTSSFKVTLHFEGSTNKPEVRRFLMPKTAVPSFTILKEKLKTVFQSLQSIPFDVMWEDEDEDQVLISSDEELNIALRLMPGDVNRLKIVVPGAHDGEGMEDTIDGAIHPGVTCDGCNEKVQGYRYKCIQCSNYDLCAVCEMKGIHKEHFVIRIPKPIFWRPEFGHRLVHQLAKSDRKFRACPGGGWNEERSRGGGHHHRSCHFSDYSRGRKNQGKIELFPQFIQYLFRHMWDPNAEVSGTQSGREEECATHNAAGVTASSNANKKPEQEDDGHVTYLRTIGETVASLLDPLGIDVNIEVETKKDEKISKPEESNVKASNESDQPSTSTGISHSTKQDTPKPEQKIRLKETVTQEEKKSEHSDIDDWTVVNKDEPSSTSQKVQDNEPMNENEANSSSTGKEANNPEFKTKKVIIAQEGTNSASRSTYPDLGQQYTQPSIPASVPQTLPLYKTPMAPTPTPVHPNLFNQPVFPPFPMQYSPNTPPQLGRHLSPQIAESLSKMTAMGYSNNGGWLTQLLEAVNGDIHKALDILQPVTK